MAAVRRIRVVILVCVLRRLPALFDRQLVLLTARRARRGIGVGGIVGAGAGVLLAGSLVGLWLRRRGMS